MKKLFMGALLVFFGWFLGLVTYAWYLMQLGYTVAG